MKKIFEQIGESIEPIDIREAIGFKADNKDDRLNESHYLITVAETLKEKANGLDYDFGTKNGFAYLFNGQYWQQITDDDIRDLLRSAASKMGIDKYKAQYYVFGESLKKQFFASTTILKEPHSQDLVINLQNGTYEFNEAPKLREFRKEDFLTYKLSFEYEPDVYSPIFEDYLNRVLPDKDCQNILAEYLGYVFTKGHKQQKCLLLYGSGANGKSVFFEIARALFGRENVTSYSLKDLNEENCRALISNKLLNYSSEINASINSDTFKQLCSGEPLQARLKYKDAFLMDNYAKLIFNCNELPKDVEHTNAYFRRFLIIPFNQIIPEHEQDKDLAAKMIKTELSGIFNWVLAGLNRLNKQGEFTESKFVDEALKNFRQESDSVFQFLDDERYEKSTTHVIALQPLYSRYQQYCMDNGFRPLSNRNFRKRIEAQGILIQRRSRGHVVFLSHNLDTHTTVTHEEWEETETPF